MPDMRRYKYAKEKEKYHIFELYDELKNDTSLTSYEKEEQIEELKRRLKALYANKKDYYNDFGYCDYDVYDRYEDINGNQKFNTVIKETPEQIKARELAALKTRLSADIADSLNKMAALQLQLYNEFKKKQELDKQWRELTGEVETRKIELDL